MKFKILFVVLLTAGAVYYIYPLKEKINLGLDLQGGIHMVLQVEMKDAMTAELDNSKSNMESVLKDEKIDVTQVKAYPEKLEIMVSGVPADKVKKAEKVFDDYMSRFNVSDDGDGAYTLSLKSVAMKEIRKQAMRQALITIHNRVDAYGVSEPIIQRQGLESNRIVVELPGLDDPTRVKKSLSEPGWLEWRLLAAPNSFKSKADVLAAGNGKLPEGTALFPSEPRGKAGTVVWYLVKDRVELNGNDIKTARRSSDQFGSPNVAFTLNQAGVTKFSRVTTEHRGERLAIILDKKVVSAPSINEPINTPNAQITGHFTIDESEDLAIKLRSGALPAKMIFLEERTVGPSLGRDSIRKGVRAAAMGLIIVMIFMLFYYKVAGINADLALTLNMLYLLGGIAYFHATLTLPGIAGFILTIGMAVDANVLIFERIKEELRNGKTPKSAISAGFSKALSAVLDGNITTLIAALFLFQYGTGPVKGFAVTLSLGIIASLFTAIYVSRWFFDLRLELTPNVKKLSI
ncbi:MAG: protein translocase subunit SecD [Acidobacteria bacterium]|nr:protein translocase subunit SecD [Acidobacteriota bacterium]